MGMCETISCFTTQILGYGHSTKKDPKMGMDTRIWTIKRNFN